MHIRSTTMAMALSGGGVLAQRTGPRHMLPPFVNGKREGMLVIIVRPSQETAEPAA
ncbi:hypothetical protein VM1G_08643 [Cytospora mali]|uniref:Uncharacterized protein n=1 Tax=Cytospora mali TaxID=578113 RepID=A0A194W8I3_CYTMA|nr:hypothetical protein VM1G_08643 [Valsa mali]